MKKYKEQQMKISKVYAKGIFFLIILINMFLITGCSQKEEPVMSYSTPSIYKQLLDSFKFPVKKNTSLIAVGDIMFHKYQLTRGYNNKTKQFDFSDAFVDVKPYIEKADFSVANLETTLAGENGSRTNPVVYGYTGYPCFNSPDVVAKNIKDTGFDLVSTANNHSLDSNTSGISRTIDVLDDNGILHVGTYKTKEESKDIKIVNVNGIDFAFLSFTYSANGFTLSKEKEHMLNSLDMYNEKKLEEMYSKVNRAYKMNVDEVVVLLHFGNEYVKYPDKYYQRPIVKKLFESGADIILGSHPHVLQPIEVCQVEREDGNIETGLVIYSLGNFLSSQSGENGKDKDIGVIMNIDFEKVGDSKPIIKGLSLFPTYTYWSKDTIGITPIKETIENKEKIKKFKKKDINRMKYAYDNTIKHLMTYLDGYKYEDIDNGYYIPIN
jgi:poly-gamma-glutamate synthesis protein (capsule biosynthesis protein)